MECAGFLHPANTSLPGFLIAQAIEKELVWQRLRQLQAEGAYLPVTVESARPAGLICKVFDALTGFIPGSHVLEVGILHRVAFPMCMLIAHAAPLSPESQASETRDKVLEVVVWPCNVMYTTVIWLRIEKDGWQVWNGAPR